MTNTVELKDAINVSGYKMDYLAKELGITRQAFSMKVNNQTSFKAEEMFRLAELLELGDIRKKAIFFNTK